MESIANPISNANEKQESNFIQNQKVESKNFDQRAKEKILKGFKDLKNNCFSEIMNQNDLEKEKFQDYFICPNGTCGEIFSGSTNLETLKKLELKNLFCNKCNHYFKFILCPHCIKKIYFDADQNPLGYTITCPYSKSCGNLFFKINCGECGINQSFKEAVTENSIIKCTNKTCAKETNFIRCPKNDCRNLIIFSCNQNNKIDNNENKFGINLFNKKIICNNLTCSANFIKFLCLKCELINFTFSGDYFEGMEIKCQNPTCKEMFKKINCPNCFRENDFRKLFTKNNQAIKEGLYENTNLPDLIQCKNNACADTFSKINCPSCKAENFSKGKKNFLEGKKINCSIASCAIEFSFFNCLICNEINFWKKSKKTLNKNLNDLIDINRVLNIDHDEKVKKAWIKREIKDSYVRGQPVKCSNCNITTAKINCPYCLEIVTFSGDIALKYGVNYTCSNPKCWQNFYINLCPCCAKTKIEKGLRIYNNFLSCPAKNKSKEINININNNLNNNVVNYKETDNNLIYNENQNTINCENKYDLVNCFQCDSYLFYYENEFNPNMALKCPQDTCKNVFLSLNCEKCSEKIILKEDQLDEFVSVECPNIACNHEFVFIYCQECKFISKTDFTNKDAFLKSTKELRKKSTLSNLKNITTNSQNVFCTKCDDCNQNNSDNKNLNLYKRKEDCEIPFKNNNKNQNKELLINFDLNSSNNNNYNKQTFLNFSEEAKGGKKFNILKQILFADGFLLRESVYKLDIKPQKISEALKKNISKNLLSVYEGNPPSFESN
jgi:hypothetical protein